MRDITIRNFKKTALVLILLGILFFSSATLTQAAFTDEITPIFCSIAKAIDAASWGVIIIAWIVVTVLFLMALGNPGRFDTAKKSVVVAVIGTVIILLGSLSIDIIEKTMGATRGGTEPACEVRSGGGERCGNQTCEPDEVCHTEGSQKWCEPK